MPMLIVLILVPTLSFYSYVLVQFVMEAVRRRHHDTCTLIVPLRSVRAEELEFGRLGLSNPSAANGFLSTDSDLHPLGAEQPTGARANGQVLSTFLRNRLSVISSQTNRPALKQTAKG